MPLPRRFTKRQWLIIAGLCTLFGGLIWWIVQPREEKKPVNPPVPVKLATVEARDVPQFLTGIGNVESKASVVIRAQVDGQLMAVHFTEGQQVKQGALLAEIDDRPLKAELAQLKAQAASTRAELVTAQADAARYANLLKEDAIARQLVDQQKAKAAQLQAALEAALANAQAAEVRLSYTKITSPVSGRVGIKRVDPGNIVRAADAEGIVTVAQIDPIDVVFTLPQGALPQLQSAEGSKPVEAFDKQGGTVLATGTLSTIDNQVDAASGTIRLKAEFANAEGKLWPGQLVVARLQAALLRQALVVPVSAVQRNVEGTFVYVAQGDAVQRKPITVGFEDTAIAVITEGLNVGEEVVIDGQSRLKADSKIRRADARSQDSQPAKSAP